MLDRVRGGRFGVLDLAVDLPHVEDHAVAEAAGERDGEGDRNFYEAALSEGRFT